MAYPIKVKQVKAALVIPKDAEGREASSAGYVRIEADCGPDALPEVWRLRPHVARALVAKLQLALMGGEVLPWPSKRDLKQQIAAGEVAQVRLLAVEAMLAEDKAADMRDEATAAERKLKGKKRAKRSGKKHKRSA